jgi:tetratricopeptide (TPR) repeat protein
MAAGRSQDTTYNHEGESDNCVAAAEAVLQENHPEPSHAEIRQQTERILGHALFLKSGLNQAFLRYIIDRALAGEASTLKESVIGREVFSRGVSFNPQIDNVVRVNANRLRSRLAEYYLTSGRADRIVIEIPRGGYVPLFRIARTAQPKPQSPPPSVHGHAVGRDRELQLLSNASQRILEGRRQLVTISGDAGLGKSTLVQLFLETITIAGWILRGGCSERLSRNEAYVSVLESLDILTFGPSSDEVVSLMNQYSPSWLAQVLPGHTIPSNSPAVPSQERMRREFLHLLQALCRIRPVILFLDDMHWADASTCDLLSYITRLGTDLPLLFVSAFRPAQLISPMHPFRALQIELSRQGASEIALSVLTACHVEEYLHRRFPVNSFPADLARIVFERTAGHPLFLSDLVNHLQQSALIINVDGCWKMATQPERLQSLVSATTQRMIRLQIDQLPAGRKRLLECAAVQGLKFDAAAVADALNLKVEAADEELQQLEKEHCFVSSEEEHLKDSPKWLFPYQFTHILYQNEFEQGLSRHQRRTFARALANALVEHHGETAGSQAAAIAALFETGNDPEKASYYFLLAASNAARLFAFPEAVDLAGRGVAVLKETPESFERDARELSLSVILGMAQMATLGYAAPEVDRTHRRARDLCLKLGDIRHLVRILWRLHTCRVNAGNLKEALALSNEMLEVSEKVGTRNAVVEALHAQASTLGFMGRLAEAEAKFRRIFEIEPIEKHEFDTSLYVLDPCVTSLSLLARLVAMKGDFGDAMQKAEMSLKLASEMAHPPSITYATFWLGFINNLAGNHERAIGYIEDVMRLAKSQDLPQFVEWARIVLGASLSALGKLEEGISQMEQSLAHQARMHCLVERPYCLTLLAEAVLRNGDPERAAQICTEALAIAHDSEARSFEAESHRIRAEAWFALNRITEAKEEGERAAFLASAAGCGALASRAALTLNHVSRSIVSK